MSAQLKIHNNYILFYPIPAMFANELLRQEQARLNEARKISVVNVNPTNIRPHSDTPEIRKYKKRFNSEILCAALWGKRGCSLTLLNTLIPPSLSVSDSTCVCSGVNLLVGTENGLMLLDRSGQGKVYNLITRRRFLQMDVLEGLNVLVTISGRSNTDTAFRSQLFQDERPRDKVLDKQSSIVYILFCQIKINFNCRKFNTRIVNSKYIISRAVINEK